MNKIIYNTKLQSYKATKLQSNKIVIGLLAISSVISSLVGAADTFIPATRRDSDIPNSKIPVQEKAESKHPRVCEPDQIAAPDTLFNDPGIGPNIRSFLGPTPQKLAKDHAQKSFARYTEEQICANITTQSGVQYQSLQSLLDTVENGLTYDESRSYLAAFRQSYLKSIKEHHTSLKELFDKYGTTASTKDSDIYKTAFLQEYARLICHNIMTIDYYKLEQMIRMLKDLKKEYSINFGISVGTDPNNPATISVLEEFKTMIQQAFASVKDDESLQTEITKVRDFLDENKNVLPYEETYYIIKKQFIIPSYRKFQMEFNNRALQLASLYTEILNTTANII